MARLEGAYEQVSQRLTNIDPRFEGVDRKIDLRFDSLYAKIAGLEDRIDQRLVSLESRMDQRLVSLESRMGDHLVALETRVDKKIDSRFVWSVGIVVTTWLSTIVSIYLHH